jgi:hypothetical protein
MSAVNFEAIAEVARRLKLEKVRKRGMYKDESASDLIPLAIVVRGKRQVAQLMPGPGPDGAREMCYWAAALMRAHELYVIADSRMRMVEKDEADQVHQGMVTEAWHAGRRQDITEVIVIAHFPMVGEPQQRLYPYVRRVTKLEWLEEITPDPGTKVQGALIDYALDGFKASGKIFADLLADLEGQPEFYPFDDETIDRGAAKFISTQGPMVVLMERTGDRVYVDGAVK